MAKIAIVTQQENNLSCKYLKTALEHEGHEVTFIQYPNDRRPDSEKGADWEFKDDTTLTRGEEIIHVSDFDGVILRSWGSAHKGKEVIEKFEAAGVVSANETKFTTISNSKVDTTTKFRESDIPMPYSEEYLYENYQPQQLTHFFQKNAGTQQRIVIKPDYGTLGESIKFPQSIEESQSIIESFRDTGHKGFVLQKFVDTDIDGKGKNVFRVIVVGGEVLGALQGYMTNEELSINYVKAKSASPIGEGSFEVFTKSELSSANPKAASLALDAAKALGNEICCGVDIIQGHQGFYVLEANDSPNLSSFHDQGIDVCEPFAKAFAAKIEKTQSPTNSPAQAKNKAQAELQQGL